MEAALAALEASAPAEWVRSARWGYAALNGTHVLGVALLVGAMVPLNLLRMGLDVGLRQEEASRVLVPSAAAGLAIAALTGILMFASRASEYAALGVFQLKIALVVLGAATALVLVAAHGWRMERATPARMRLHGLVSLILWLAVLYLGRIIAFTG